MARRKSKSKTSRLPYPVRQQIEQAREYLEAGEAQRAGMMLRLLDEKYSERPEVLELWVDFYYARQDWPAYEWNLHQLLQVAPDNALASYALSAAHQLVDRPALAVRAASSFLQRWPEHEKAHEARQVLAEAQPQAARRMQEHGLPADRLDLLEAFEWAEMLYENEEFPDADSQIGQVLGQQAEYLQALRLQGLIQQETGELVAAQASVERLLVLRPDDRAARAQQVQLQVRLGEPAAARRTADELLSLPPQAPEDWVHYLEALTWLDEVERALELYHRSRKAGRETVKALDETTYFLHMAAYAHAVRGQEKTARELWQRALELDPYMLQASDNLDDLQEPPTQRCGPWALGLFDWLPPALFSELFTWMEENFESRGMSLGQDLLPILEGQPLIVAAAPGLLQRSNRLGIELVLGLAALSQHPALLDALAVFVTGQHGRDSHRLQAAYLLLASGRLDPGEQRLWLFGGWQTVRLRRYEVTYTPVRVQASPRVQRMADRATEALLDGNYARGRDLLEKALALEPDLPELINNLAFAYRELDELDRAQALVEDLRQRHPDYLLGIYAEAHMALGRGDTEAAAALLEQIADQPALHISELASLCQTQVELLMDEKRRVEALVWLELWAFHEPDSSEVEDLRQEYFEPKDPSGLAEKLMRRLSGPAAPDD